MSGLRASVEGLTTTPKTIQGGAINPQTRDDTKLRTSRSRQVSETETKARFEQFTYIVISPFLPPQVFFIGFSVCLAFTQWHLKGVFQSLTGANNPSTVL